MIRSFTLAAQGELRLVHLANGRGFELFSVAIPIEGGRKLFQQFREELEAWHFFDRLRNFVNREAA